jgi:hypothetical protein
LANALPTTSGVPETGDLDRTNGARRRYPHSLDGVTKVARRSPTSKTLLYLYDIQSDDRLSEYGGHLIIDWGKSFIVWAQRAQQNDKQILEIRKR